MVPTTSTSSTLEAPPETADHTALGYTFNAVLRIVAEHLGQSEADALKKSLGLGRLLDFFRYPAADCWRLIEASAMKLSSRLGSREAALREIGASVAAGFFTTTMGKMLLTLAGGTRPDRILTHVQGAYRTSVSWGERSYESTGPQSCLLHIRGEILQPEFQAGVVEGSVRGVSKVDARVEIVPLGKLDYDFHVRW